MATTCPRCHRSLPTDESADAPFFCMYCGNKLREDSTPTNLALMRTGSFSPAPTADTDGDDATVVESVPSEIGGYRLLRLLGCGGMGTVYEGEAPATGQRVAVKLLSSRLSTSPISVERFRQEGRLASQVAHPRCVFVLSADTDAGRPYIVMELMPGETLKDVVDKRGPLPPGEAVERILDVIDGLSEAHRVGMIHRDIKPSNCFLTADDRVKVGDFGLSKSLADSRENQLTQTGAFLGTVLFASPEQIRGEPLDYGCDVYAVCATLYYLLCGEAPYHHESVTAALAKAISEDAPSIRGRRPEVSPGLDAAVMKGLERDRDHRWQSLDDLRDALVNLLPSRQRPARPRSLVAAYLLDRIVLVFLIFPAELVHVWALGVQGAKIDLSELRLLPALIGLTYFTICEGLFGATPGKWLLGLRVSRMGQTGPPGLGRALLRSVVFHALLIGFIAVPEILLKWLGSALGGALGGMLFLGCGAALLYQVLKRSGFRGLHDLASDCHVTQKPLPSRKLRLPVRQATLVNALLPAPSDPLPATVGSYAVRGRIAIGPSGDQVWIGEDRALGRAVLLWLKPSSDREPTQPEVFRPTRLRRLGSGSLSWAGQSFDWLAFAAPLGGPLSEAVRPNRPLPWADARYLLDQLIEEIRAAETDGTIPAHLGIDQVWVEPNGRVQLLDCSPIAGATVACRTPLELLRAVASLALEGHARNGAGPIQAPIPPHARPAMDRLFSDGGYRAAADLERDLAETRHLQPEVTPAVRAAQLGIQSALLSTVLAFLFLLAAAVGPVLELGARIRADQADVTLAMVADAAERAKLADDPRLPLAEALKSPRLITRLEDYRDRKRAEAELRRSMLLRPQRWVVEQRELHAPKSADEEAGYPTQVRELVQWAGAPENTPRGKSASPWHREWAEFFALLAAVPVGLVLAAAIFRGGLSMLLAGIALVRADGRRASRRQCGVRAALIWFPVTALLIGSAALQAFAPERFHLAAGLWLLALVLLPVYIVVALRYPSQPPQDRLTGTYLVPV